MPNQKVSKEEIAKLRIAIIAVDVVLFTIYDRALRVFLVPVHRPPHYSHLYGLPGGVMMPRETAEATAARCIKEKIHLKNLYLEQLATFTDPDRDKRSRSISIAYMGLITSEASFAEMNIEGAWFEIKKLPSLAYDHPEIIRTAYERLKGKLVYTNIIANVLPQHFTLTEIQQAYEVILDRELDKRNFRKKILSIGLVKPVGQQKKTVHRPAELYTFVHRDQIIIPEIRAVL
jgi:8-oxo-dGTP diphosphatase